MADNPHGPDYAELPEAVAQPRRRRALQFVWILPIVALAIGAWLVLKAVLSAGPVITIAFRTAEGLEAGKTRIKYKNVDIGTVTAIDLSKDASGVIVTAQINKKAGDLLVADTRFWVVRPRIAGGQVSGLGTLLSGAYIGVDRGKSTEPKREFVGLEVPPVVTAGVPGRLFTVKSEDLASLDIGAPVYFRHIQAGEVVAYELDADGKGITAKIFVHASYHRYVTTDTRFWEVSGINVSLDANGLKIDTESLVSLLIGGIAFQSPPESLVTREAPENSTFTLFHDRAAAMRSPESEARRFVLHFRDSLRGLAPGAPLDFRGVVIGEVKSIDLVYDPVTKTFRFPVEVALYTERMGARNKSLPADAPANGAELFDPLVEKGFRAQLRAANLLTGQLYVALDFFPNAPKAKIDWSKAPAELPTVTGSWQELQVTIANIAKKLDSLPLEDIAKDVRRTLATLDRTLKDADRMVQRVDSEIAPELRAAIEQAKRTLVNAERTLAADAPLQHEARETLRELTRAAQSLRTLMDYLERHPESLIRGKKEETR